MIVSSCDAAAGVRVTGAARGDGEVAVRGPVALLDRGEELRSRATLGVLLIGCLLLSIGTAPAHAKGDPRKRGTVRDLAVTPKKPATTDTLHVSFTAGRLRPNERYEVGLSGVGGDNSCVANRSVRVRGVPRSGRRVEVDLSPVGSGGNGRFCPGRATMVIARVDVEQRIVLLASRAVTLTRDPRDPLGLYGPQPVLDTPVSVDVLDGSSFLVQANGRPDRTLPVGGRLRGVLPGTFKPNSDLGITSLSGPLFLRSIVPDPLCAGASYTSELGVAPGAAGPMTLKASGGVTFPLTLTVAPQALAGCGAPPAGTTPLSLSGRVGPAGLVSLALTGSVTGVPIADGVTATVTANLLVKIDLSGR